MIPADVLDLVKKNSHSHALIDVRSEGEFYEGSLPGFISLPILTDSERHQVGLAYKQRGQEEAIALGQRLVAPFREQRTAAWKKAAQTSLSGKAILTCWRGGLRSRIACEWLRAEGIEVHQVVGGYKAIRGALLNRLDSIPESLVLGGMTGSGKTTLLRQLSPHRVLDLEEYACHRGSAFGRDPDRAQPSQSTFENRIAFALLTAENEIVIENESVCIGSVHIPKKLRTQMAAAPMVQLEIPRDQRSQFIYENYVTPSNHDGMASALLLIRRRLGGMAFDRIHKTLNQAYANESKELHLAWIADLLETYYDGLYEYSQKKASRRILFKGNHEECMQWLNQRFVSPKP